MNLFSRNAGLILKTFLYQVVMSLFGFMMYGATYRIPLLLVVGQATMILFFLYIVSSQTYQSGAKCCEYNHSHGTKSSPWLGFLFMLIAFLPTFALAVTSVLIPPFGADGTTNSVGYLSYLGNHTFLQGMYVGITQHVFPTSAGGASETLMLANAEAINARCILHLFGAIPGILAGGIGYFLGFHQFSKEKK